MIGCLLEACLPVLNGLGCYLLGGVLTALFLVILCRDEVHELSDLPPPRAMAKLVLLWPAVVAMAVVFALILIVNGLRRNP